MKKILSFRPLVYAVFLLTFALIPLSLIEEHSFCLIRLFTGMKCAGCGVTRGFCAFMHFDFARAAAYNPVFAYAVFPISIFLMLEDTVFLICRRFSLTARRSLIEEGIISVFKFLGDKN